MISALATTPILVISMDPYFDQDALLKSVSDPLPAVTDLNPDVPSEKPMPITDAINGGVLESYATNTLSDVTKIERRIPIPITDALWDVAYVSGNASSYNEVTPMDLPQLVSAAEIEATEDRTRKVVTVGRQIVQLTFRVKSEVMALSSLRDTLDYIGLYKPMTSGAITHVSFYSPTLCIYDAILVGYGKSHSESDDLGSITLSLELVDEIKVDPISECINLDQFFENFEYGVEAPEKGKGPNGEIKAEGDVVQIEGPSTRQGETTMNVLPHNEVYSDYTWYLVSDLNGIQSVEVPAHKSNQTIQLNKFVLYRCISKDGAGNSRNLQGIKWLDKNISLEGNLGGKFWKDVAIARIFEEENNPLNQNIQLIFGVR